MESNSPQDRDPYPARKRRRRSSISASRSAHATTPNPELGHMRSDVTGSTSFVGSGSGIHFVRMVRSAFARNISWDSEAVDAEMVPGEDDRIQTRRESRESTPRPLWAAEEVHFANDSQGEAPGSITFDDLVHWSQSYFTLWHPPFPFLHAPTILGLFNRVSIYGISQLSTTEAIIVRSILSISRADRRQMPRDGIRPIPSSLIFNTIDEATSCLAPVLTQSASITGLQAALSVQIFFVSMLRLNSASRFGALIVRIAFHLGIHRCPARYKQFTKAEADIRRRLFWTIYSLERFLAQSLGLPVSLKDDDLDVCLPYNEVHLPDGESTGGPDQPTEERLFLLPMFLARSSKIKGLILELRHISVSNRVADPDEVAHIDAKISKWWNEVQDYISPVDDDEEMDETRTAGSVNRMPSHELLLIVQKHESVILLNRPVITAGHNSYAVAAAMQKCIGASKSIISSVFQHLQQGKRETGSLDGRIGNPLFWPGFTWCVWMSGLILLYAASDGSYSVEMAQKEASRCVKILENLSLRGIFWPSTCAAAIKDLQQALNAKIGKNSNSGQLDTSATVLQSTSRPSPGETTSRLSLHPERSRNEIVSSSPMRKTHSATMNQSPGIPNGPGSSSNAAATVFSDQNGSGQTRQTLFSPASSSFPETWPGMRGQLHPMDDQFNSFNNFDDIFQLMDVPYHLSEHTFETSGGPFL